MKTMGQRRKNRRVQHTDSPIKNQRERQYYGQVIKAFDAEATIEDGLNFDVSDKVHSLDNMEVKAIGTRKPKLFKRISNHFMENISEYIIGLLVVGFCGFVLTYIFNHNKEYGILDTKYEYLSESLKVGQESLNNRLKEEIEKISLTINELRSQIEKLKENDEENKQDILDKVRSLENDIIELKMMLKMLNNI